MSDLTARDALIFASTLQRIHAYCKAKHKVWQSPRHLRRIARIIEIALTKREIANWDD